MANPKDLGKLNPFHSNLLIMDIDENFQSALERGKKLVTMDTCYPNKYLKSKSMIS